MSYARLKLNFTKIANANIEYIMRTVIDTVYSTPDEIDACLVVAPGSAGADERLLRIADLGNLITTPRDLLPTAVDQFISPSLASIPASPPGTYPIVAGDFIRVDTPFLWQQFFGAVAYIEYEVSSVPDPDSEVIVTPAFPAFGRNLTFAVRRGANWILPYSGTTTLLSSERPINGLANRDYSAVSGIEFLASSHADSWTDLSAANAAQVSFRGEAQSLVDELNEDNYGGTSEETFE